MRTNIILDDKLINEAFFLRGKKKRGLVYKALKEFVEHRKRQDLRDLKGMGGCPRKKIVR